MMVDGTYYQKSLSYGNNYKEAVCQKTSNTITVKDCIKTTITWTKKVGLPQYGEMFASQQGTEYSNSEYIWLIAPHSSSSSNVWNIDRWGTAFDHSIINSNFAARPSIPLKSTIKITGGKGIKQSPFSLGE